MSETVNPDIEALDNAGFFDRLSKLLEALEVGGVWVDYDVVKAHRGTIAGQEFVLYSLKFWAEIPDPESPAQIRKTWGTHDFHVRVGEPISDARLVFVRDQIIRQLHLPNPSIAAPVGALVEGTELRDSAMNEDCQALLRSNTLVKFAHLTGDEKHVNVGLRLLDSYREHRRSGQVAIFGFVCRGECSDYIYEKTPTQHIPSVPRPVDFRFSAYMPAKNLSSIDPDISGALLRDIVMQHVAVENLLG